MFDNKNSNQLKTVLAEYFKNVVIDGNTTAYTNYSSRLNTSPTSYFLGKQTVPAAAVDGDVELLNTDPKDIPTRTAWNKTKWRKVDGQYQQLSNGNWTDVAKSQLAAALSFDSKVGYKATDDVILQGEKEDDEGWNWGQWPWSK